MSDDALDDGASAVADARDVLMALAIPSWMRIGASIQIDLCGGHELGMYALPIDDPVLTVLRKQRAFRFPLLGDIVGINIASHYPVEVRCPFDNGDVDIRVPIDSVSPR